MNALLDGKATDIADKGPDERFREPSVVKIEDVLDDVVTEGILNEIQRIENDFSDELESLRWRSVINRTLEDAAAVSMGGDFYKVGGDSIVDELVVFGDELVEAFLDNLKNK